MESQFNEELHAFYKKPSPWPSIKSSVIFSHILLLEVSQEFVYLSS